MRERVSVFHYASVGTGVFAIHADAISRDRISLGNALVTPARFFSTRSASRKLKVDRPTRIRDLLTSSNSPSAISTQSSEP